MKKINLKTVVKNVENQLYNLASHLICSICQELLSKSVTTPCGHSFCSGCIRRVLSKKDNSGCPLCKNLVKRYYLEVDNVKSTLSDICKELPYAFEMDVQDLSHEYNEPVEDIIKLSKLAQLYNAEIVKESKSNKKKNLKSRKLKDIEGSFKGNDTDFLPVLKRSKNVLEYASAKKKRMDDLVSISQTEIASVSSFCESSDIDKKLEKIEKILPEEKVKEWFDAVGDNIFNNSPNSSIDSFQVGNIKLNISSKEHQITKRTSMVRRDYNKPISRKFKSKENDVSDSNSNLNDPYDFVPSQQNTLHKKKKAKKNVGKEKKIPEFQAIHNFTKESIKRCELLLNQIKEPTGDAELEISEADHNVSLPSRERKNEISASQKFDNLLSETKKNEKKNLKAHVLYSASQASSPKLLDCSFHSKIETFEHKIGPVNSKRNIKTNLMVSDGEQLSIKASPKVELFTDFCALEKEDKKTSKRKRSLETYKSTIKKKRLTCPLKISEIKKVNNDMISGFKPTKLLQLLNELLTDEVIFGNVKSKVSKQLSTSVSNEALGKDLIDENEKLKVPMLHLNHKNTENKVNNLINFDNSQNCALLGFSTQEMSSTKETKFKEMVASMEKELNLEIFISSFNDEVNISKFDKNKNNKKIESPPDIKQSMADANFWKNEIDINSKIENDTSTICSFNKNTVPFNLVGKIKKDKIFFVKFLLLGRLTPTVKRSKSSVVKLVFPIGLSSFSRKRPSSNKFEVGVQTSQVLEISNNGVSNGKQTKKEVSSAFIQTSPKETFSVEIQTTQNFSSDHEKSLETKHLSQNNNLYKSIEIQTSQVRHESVEIQTTQFQKISNFDDEVEIEKEKEGKEYSLCLIKNEIQGKMSIDDIKGPFHENDHVNFSPPNFKSKYNENDTSTKMCFLAHKKLINNKNFVEEIENISSPEIISLSPKKNQKQEPWKTLDKECLEKTPNKVLIIDSEVEREFEKSWMKNSQFVELKNKKNKEKIKEKLGEAGEQSDDSEIQSFKRNKIQSRILSEDSNSPVKCLNARQETPLDIKKKDDSDHSEIINVESSNSKESQCSEEEMLRVLKNIDLDLMKIGSKNLKSVKNFQEKKNLNEENILKGEESDSDFFVEQTPPRQIYSKFLEPGPKKVESHRKILIENGGKQENHSEGTDLIGDSIPKGFTESESFLMLSAPEKILLTPVNVQNAEKNHNENFFSNEICSKRKTQEISKKDISEKPQSDPFSKTSGNVQKQINANKEGKIKKQNLDTETLEVSSNPLERPLNEARTLEKKKLCVVASGVKNPEMIKKFVSKFKIEYSNKPTKTMTHLIVGLHENDEREILPLCTPKLLFAMANKKWVVSELWAETCLKKNEILPEDEFETLDPVGSQGCRTARLSSQNLLENCEIYLLGNFLTMNKEEFADLIKDCGGTIINQPEKFSRLPSRIRMIIADRDCLNMDEKQLQEFHERYSTVILSRDVIIMSIQSYKLANFTPYLLHLTSEGELLKMGYPPFLAKNEDEDEVESL